VAPLLADGDQRAPFSNFGIARGIVQVLGEMGYEVDVVEWLNTACRPGKAYDLFVGHGGTNWEYLSRNVVGNAVKIYFSTGIYWKAWNEAERNRFSGLETRRGVRLPYDRYIQRSEEYACHDADGIITLGGQRAASTYAGFPHCRGINNAAYTTDTYAPSSKDFVAGRRRFLFFGSRGSVHKGLDLAIEAFTRLDGELYCAGIVEPEFLDAYRKDLESHPNIQLCGWIAYRSQRFYQLIDACNYVILPSCAEGQPGSVLECMHHGLVPVLSRECNIDTQDFGITLREATVEEIAHVATELMGKPVNWHRHMALRTLEAAKADYSETAFCRQLRAGIEAIIDRASHVRGERRRAAEDESRDRVTMLEPRDLGVLLRRAAWLRSEGRSQEALAFLERAAQADPQCATARCEMAELALDRGDIRKASRLLAQVRRLLPNDVKLESLLARLQGRQQKTDQVVCAPSRESGALPTGSSDARYYTQAGNPRQSHSSTNSEGAAGVERARRPALLPPAVGPGDGGSPAPPECPGVGVRTETECVAKAALTGREAGERVRSLLWIRTDAIGDNVLAMSMLPLLHEHFAGPRITAVCQQHVGELYAACPFVSEVIGFDRGNAYADPEYLRALIARLQSVRADLVLNTVYSREVLTDLLALESRGRASVAYAGDAVNAPRQILEANNQRYGRLVPGSPGRKPELERHRDFLSSLGVTAPPLAPRVWLGSQDKEWAARTLAEHGLESGGYLAFFTGAQDPQKRYARWAEAIADVCKSKGLSVVALGAAADRGSTQSQLDALGPNTFNLCGRTSLLRSAALIGAARLALGPDTGLAHMACAVGTPNVVVIGGGHFGRFMPYSALTSLVCLPLDCYGCDWRCRYPKARCIADIPPETVRVAVEQTLAERAERPRVFVARDHQACAAPLRELDDKQPVTVVSVGPPSSPRADRKGATDLQSRLRHKLSTRSGAQGQPADVSILVACNRYLQRFRVFARSICHQDYDLAKVEVVVANPHSPDGLSPFLAVLEHAAADGPGGPRFREVLVDPSFNRNRGYLIQRAFEACTGEVIIGMDCDLVIPRGFLRALVEAVQQHPQSIVGVYRQFLSAQTTDKILAGMLDPHLAWASVLAEDQQEEQGYRGVLGYCQATLRKNWEMVGYPEEFDNIAKSDVAFVERLGQCGVTPLFLKDLHVLHLNHPRNWEGTQEFL
jgi:ADP-heptose:LPS heptosyltransferase/glycosyltransferase involved in cell wall biosynthesis